MVHVIFTEQTQYYYWFLFSNEQDFLAKNKSNGTPKDLSLVFLVSGAS